MGSGCFKPESTKGHIDIQVLDNVYEDIKSIELPLYPSHSAEQSYSIYAIIKQKIIKKGQLKKLCDYLSSHRHRICDNLMHNLRIVTQTKDLHSKYVAIITLEQFFKLIPQQKSHLNLSLKTLQSCQDSLHNIRQNKNQSVKSITNITSKLNEGTQNQINGSVACIISQITSFKFQAIYMNLINFLLKENGEIYSLGVKNLRNYCQLTNTPFNETEAIHQLMKKIHNHIQLQDHLLESLKGFDSMLLRMKDSFYTKNLQLFRTFIQLQLSSEEGSDQFQIGQKTQISDQCSQICSKYLRSCWEVEHFQVFLNIFIGIMDRNEMKNVEHIQIFFFELINQIQLKDQFNKYMLKELLTYASFPSDNNILAQKWMQIFQGQKVSYLKKYKNILKKQVKINCLHKINKWINQYSLISHDNLMICYEQHLVYTYLLNLFHQSTQVQIQVVNQMINLVNSLKKQHQIILLNSLNTATKQYIFKDKQKFVIYVMILRSISKLSNVNIPMKCQDMFPCIQLQNGEELNRKIMEYMGVLLSQVSSDSIRNNLQNICQFLLSVYKVVSSNQYPLKWRIIILNSYNKNLQVIPQHKYSGIIAAFTQRIQILQNKAEQTQSKYYLFSDIIINYNLKYLEQKYQNLEQFFTIFTIQDDNQIYSLLEKYNLSRESQAIPLNFNNDKNKNKELYVESCQFLQQNRVTQMEQSAGMSGFANLNSIISRESHNKQQDNNLESILDILRK